MSDSTNKLNSITKITNDIVNFKENYLKQLENLKTDDSSEADIQYLESVKSILLRYIYVKSIDTVKIRKDEIMVKIIIDLFDKLYLKYVQAIEKIDNTEINVLEKNLNQIVREITPDMATILNFETFLNIKFCNRFLENNGLDFLFKYLTNQTLLSYYQKESKNIHSPEFQNIDYTLRRITGSLVCLARAYSNYKNKWKDSQSVKNFLLYLNKTKDIVDNKVYCCLAIAFVADDEDIDQLPDLKDILPDITTLIGKASKMIEEDKDLKRIEVQLDDSSNKTKEVCCVFHMDTGWSIINLLKALYHLSVNDKLKHDIYYKHDMDKYLRSIINNGNDVEKEYCLMLLWQLCFDKKIASDVQKDSVLLEYILKLSNDKDENRKELTKNAYGIIWLLNKSSEEDDIKAKEKKAETPMAKEELNIETINKKHIMISYNRDSRDLCLKIKNELEKDGFKIWIDVEDIHGSSLDSMANAIENSVCVLMCMTEKYKQSANCRAEAEYSFQLGRPIIPLIMQKDYKPDGWLGIILGSKIFVHFMKYDFEECIRRLKAEIEVVFRDNKIKVEILGMWKPSDSANKKPEIIQAIINDDKKTIIKDKIDKAEDLSKIKNWNENDVDKWLNETNIHTTIANCIKPCDGKLLCELYQLKKETPEFFYKSLTKTKHSYRAITLKDLAHFTIELKKIFKN